MRFSEPDLACFGYLAWAQVNTVAAYPPANTGAVVRDLIASLAGDAPIVALTAGRLGSSTTLISNRVGLDHTGQTVLELLDSAAVAHWATPSTSGTSTPQLIIVTDEGRQLDLPKDKERFR